MMCRWVAILAYVFIASLASAADNTVISVFGSSVADGAYCSGNCSGRAFDPSIAPGGCYQSRLRQYQTKYRNRSVFNNCKGGDTTTKLLERFYQMTSTKAGLVFIGLSMANEGLPETKHYDHIFQHYESGMRELVQKSRRAGAQPVLGSNYPNSGYNEEQYAYIKRMNLLTQTWDLQTPQVNFLGTIDDGHGRWVRGFHANGGHPNSIGSTEMYYAFVPSIFDAILAGKAAVPQRATGSQFLTLQRGSNAELVQFAPRSEDIMHSFTLSFRVQCEGCTGLIAALEAEETAGSFACPTNWCKDHGYAEDTCGCGVCGSFGGCSWSCDPMQSASSHPLHPCASSASHSGVPGNSATDKDVDYSSPAPTFPDFVIQKKSMTNRSLEIDSRSGRLVYGAASLPIPTETGPVINDGSWHTLLLTHYWCNGTTTLYADGQFVSQSQERLGPTLFQLRPGTSAPVSYQDLLIYRSGLNVDEQEFLLRNKTHVLQASLEIYAPLDGANPLQNRAQSMSEIRVGPAAFMTEEVVV